MAGECFWTALVNCFDDCAAAPPPEPEPELAYVLGEDFATLPSSRAPSAGPPTFTAASNAQVGVSDGFMVSTVASAVDGMATVTFAGPSGGTEPAIGLSIGLAIDTDMLVQPGFTQFVGIAVTATEDGSATKPIRLNFSTSTQTRTYPASTSSQMFNGIGDNWRLESDGEGGEYDEYDTFAGFAEQPVYFLNADALHDLRLMWDGAALVATVNGIENASETFTAGPLDHMPRFSEVVVTISSWGSIQQAISIDYVRLIGEP